MCLVSYSRASGATEWNVASVCAPHLQVHVVTPPSQEGSERITFIYQLSNTSPVSLETAPLGYQISQMECDLPSVKYKNFLIRIVGNFSNLFQHLCNEHFCCLQIFSTNKLIFVLKNISIS